MTFEALRQETSNVLITIDFLDAHGLGDLIYPEDHMIARYLNRLVDDQGAARSVSVTADTFYDLLLRRFRSRTTPR